MRYKRDKSEGDAGTDEACCHVALAIAAAAGGGSND